MSQPPGPYGPPSGYPGQGMPPSGGFPQQQPGFGPQQGQPQYGPPQGQPGQFGPPQGPPPGFPPGFDPYGGGGPQKKSPLPWILGGVGALVVIGGVILLIVLLGGSSGPGSTAEATGEAAAEAIGNKDIDALKALLCNADAKMAEANPDSGPLNEVEDKQLSAEFISATENGDKGEAKLKVTEEGEGTQDVTLPLVKEEDEWRVCFSSGMTMPGSPPPGGEVPNPVPGGEAPPPGMPSVPIPPPATP